MTLSGKTILITRAAAQAEELVELVKRYGGTPIVFSTIEIVPPISWDTCDRAIDSLYMYDGLIFTSANGVEFFFRRMSDRTVPADNLRSKAIYVVGEKTKQAVEGHGCAVTLVPEKFTAIDLARTLQQEDLQEKCFLFPGGNLGNTFLGDTLKLLGAQVDQVVVYQTQKPPQENIEPLRTMLMNGNIQAITFTSPSTVKNFAALFTPAELSGIKRRTTVAVIGPVTADAADKIGFEADIVAEQSSIDSLILALLKHFHTDIRTTHSETIQ